MDEAQQKAACRGHPCTGESKQYRSLLSQWITELGADAIVVAGTALAFILDFPSWPRASADDLKVRGHVSLKISNN